MKVVIPMLSAAANISGVQRHAINLARCLVRLPEIRQVHLLAGSWQRYLAEISPSDPRLKVDFHDIRNTGVARNFWYYAQLPGICNELGADIVHLAYPVPVRTSSFKAPVVTTLHDMYPFDLPENFGFPKVLFNQRILLQCLRAVDAIACVSNSTMHRLERLEPGLALSKAVVAPNAVEHNPAEMTRPAAIGEDDQFLLCIAQHRRNKNILLLLDSFRYLRQTEQTHRNARLVIVGVSGPETAAIQRFIRTHELQQSVLLLAGLSEGELKWCYRRCTVLVSPSIIEGFGLPIAEGLLAGCRIVCSDIPAFREIGGNACRYTRLNDDDAVRQLSGAIAEASVTPQSESMCLPSLSFETVGRQYINLYGLLGKVERSSADFRTKRKLNPGNESVGQEVTH